MARILILDDDEATAAAYEDCLQEENHVILCAGTVAQAQEQLKTQPDLAILDLYLAHGESGLTVLRQIRDTTSGLPVIMISGAADISDALEAVRAGAWDFLEKPVSRAKLRIAVRNALGATRSRREAASARDALLQRWELTGQSHSMKELMNQVARLAPSDLAVLIEGETGTGKELVAHQLHFRSPRWGSRLVKINCGALPENLMEAELFGYARGAFTGASGERDGLVAESEGGTLFLDEIGELPLALQTSLLRLLESGEYCRLGETKLRQADFRLLSATNRHVREEVAAGSFREDLYYRIAGATLCLPPLRDRHDDVTLLADSLLGELCERQGVPRPEVADSAWKELQTHPFPGNVRELKQVLERTVVLADPGETIRRFVLDPMPSQGLSNESLGSLAAAKQKLLADYLDRRLTQLNGSKKLLADELGIHVNNLYRLLRRN